jgi:ABC-type nickel/cobalt efflux system permease component RcnA
VIVAVVVVVPMRLGVIMVVGVTVMMVGVVVVALLVIVRMVVSAIVRMVRVVVMVMMIVVVVLVVRVGVAGLSSELPDGRCPDGDHHQQRDAARQDVRMELLDEDEGQHRLANVEHHGDAAERPAQGDGENLIEEVVFVVFVGMGHDLSPVSGQPDPSTA